MPPSHPPTDGSRGTVLWHDHHAPSCHVDARRVPPGRDALGELDAWGISFVVREINDIYWGLC